MSITPKEKAAELVNQFLKCDKIYFSFVTYTNYQIEVARKSALVCVGEILKSIKFNSDLQPKFWNEVENELKKYKHEINTI